MYNKWFYLTLLGTIKDIYLRPSNFDINIDSMIQETVVSVAEMQGFKSPPSDDKYCGF